MNVAVMHYINRHLRAAGWRATEMRTGVEIKTKDSADDFVTQADRELDVMLGAALAQIVPGCADFSENSSLPNGLITEERVETLSPAVAHAIASRRHVWYLDPIDGTDNYVKQDGQYTVMLGLVVGGRPTYGWIYAPAQDELYFGGPPSQIGQDLGYVGLLRKRGSGTADVVVRRTRGDGRTAAEHLRVIMGSRDRRDHPEIVERLNASEWVSVGSLGLKVMAIVGGTADVYVHCSQQLKFWDTAAPIALAAAADLMVCDLDGEPITFTPHADAAGAGVFRHRQTVLIGTSEGVAAARRRLAAVKWGSG